VSIVKRGRWNKKVWRNTDLKHCRNLLDFVFLCMKSHNIEAIGRLQSRKKNLTKRQLP